jgi:hypothetical protein
MYNIHQENFGKRLKKMLKKKKEKDVEKMLKINMKMNDNSDEFNALIGCRKKK